MKTILAVLADGFEETEAVAVLDVLRRLEFDVTTAGLKAREVMGAHWIPMVADTSALSINEAYHLIKIKAVDSCHALICRIGGLRRAARWV